MRDKQALATRVIHAGQMPDPTTGAVMPPISLSSTYVQKSPGQHQGFEYSRSHNPSRFAYERSVADLENGRNGFAFASGMAAIACVLELLTAGDHVIAMDDLYGGTYRLFENVRKRSAGLSFSFLDMQSAEAIEAAMTPKTRMIWVETPTNPMLKIVDLAMIAEIAHKHKLIAVCDNTFASPIVQQPLDFGFHLVVHSATKYLGGHSDVVSGVVVVKDDKNLIDQMTYLQNSIGSVAGPFDSYLVLRGIKTLALRMQRHCENAQAIAEFLASHSKVEAVYYPGLPTHTNHHIAKKQMHGFGGVVSCVVKGGVAAAVNLLERCQLFALAESLGGVESLIEHPAIMTHASVPLKQRQQLGISDGLIRLSVGIEAVEDLQKDLSQAFA